MRRQLGVARGVLDVLVTELRLQRAGVVAGIGERITTRVPKPDVTPWVVVAKRARSRYGSQRVSSISAGCSQLAWRLSGPALECMRECAHLMKAEQPRYLGYVQLAVIEVTNCQIAPQLLKYFSEVQPFVRKLPGRSPLAHSQAANSLHVDCVIEWPSARVLIDDRYASAWSLRARSGRPGPLAKPGVRIAAQPGHGTRHCWAPHASRPCTESGTLNGSARRWPQRACAEGDGDAEGDGGAVTGAGLRAGAAVAPGGVAESLCGVAESF
jgi:hypothetical protein